MKTNVLWLCQYCDKKLSSKGTVKGHISKQHKADPDMDSPKEVTSTLLIDQTSDKDAPTNVVDDGENVTKESVVKTKSSEQLKEKVNRKPSYDFKKLSNIFSKPELSEDMNLGYSNDVERLAKPTATLPKLGQLNL